MSTEVYYFSGTGNSLHVANELQKRIPHTTLIPMVSLINKDIIETNADTVGLVFPLRRITVPAVVQDVISKLELNSAKYVFLIATRFGTPCNYALKKIEKLLAPKEKTLDAHLILNMASNDPKFENWHPATKEELDSIEAIISEKIDKFAKTVIDRVPCREQDTSIIFPINPLLERIAAYFADKKGYSGDEFFADSKCSACGTCEKVCLSGKITLVEGKPVWKRNFRCYICYACINFCPQQAIQTKSSRILKTYTEKNGRYFHPQASVADIAQQKEG